jgi:hypothetical protein
MSDIQHFVPPTGPGEEVDILARLRQPIPAGVTPVYLEAYTRPGDLVVVPYCQGPGVVHEIVATGRRALALNFDPLLALLTRVMLSPLPPREMDAAVARVGDSLKHGMPLRQSLLELYSTSCPACGRPVAADYFVWEREGEAPLAKQIHCPACEWDGEAAAGPEDRERAAEVRSRGMHYHYLRERVLPALGVEPGLRERLETLLGLYSQRNLYALAELTIKVESLFPEGPVQQALKLLLLDCLERCSSLAVPPGRTTRRDGLTRPPRFLERNVWRAFEEATGRLGRASGRPGVELAASIEAMLAPGEGAPAFAGQGLVRDLPQKLPPRSQSLIISSPPPLNAAAWSLSYLWGAWLLDAEAVAPLLPLIRQRRADAMLYARVMASSLQRLGGLLRDDGRLVLVPSGQRPAVVDALVLAAGSARLALRSLVARGDDYRLELSPSWAAGPGAPAPASDVPLETASWQAALAVIETIRARGEPAEWSTLHAAMQHHLSATGLLARPLEAAEGSPTSLELLSEQMRSALEDPALERLAPAGGSPELWWLARPRDLSTPLADRVEAAAHDLLQSRAEPWSEAEFERAMYALFPGNLTPRAGLVPACLRSYGQEVSPGQWQLRPGDLPQKREVEREAVIGQLLALGERMGYRAAPLAPFDAAWFEGKRQQALFVVRWRAAVHEALSLGGRPGGAQRYLVIPGGRAALAGEKLERNPLLQRAMEDGGWRFIKYRHVRQLAGQAEVDEYVLRTIVGLDPVAEQEAAQLRLF